MKCLWKQTKNEQKPTAKPPKVDSLSHGMMASSPLTNMQG